MMLLSEDKLQPHDFTMGWIITHFKNPEQFGYETSVQQ